MWTLDQGQATWMKFHAALLLFSQLKHNWTTSKSLCLLFNQWCFHLIPTKTNTSKCSNYENFWSKYHRNIIQIPVVNCLVTPFVFVFFFSGLVTTTFDQFLDDWNLLYMNVTDTSPQTNNVYHVSMRFNTNCWPSTHHLYSRVHKNNDSLVQVFFPRPLEYCPPTSGTWTHGGLLTFTVCTQTTTCCVWSYFSAQKREYAILSTPCPCNIYFK